MVLDELLKEYDFLNKIFKKRFEPIFINSGYVYDDSTKIIDLQKNDERFFWIEVNNFPIYGFESRKYRWTLFESYKGIIDERLLQLMSYNERKAFIVRSYMQRLHEDKFSTRRAWIYDDIENRIYSPSVDIGYERFIQERTENVLEEFYGSLFAKSLRRYFERERTRAEKMLRKFIRDKGKLYGFNLYDNGSVEILLRKASIDALIEAALALKTILLGRIL